MGYHKCLGFCRRFASLNYRMQFSLNVDYYKCRACEITLLSDSPHIAIGKGNFKRCSCCNSRLTKRSRCNYNKLREKKELKGIVKRID